MNKIAELIEEYCADGVRFDTIGQFAEVASGATPSKSVPEYWADGTIPWLSSGEVNKGTVYEADTFITQAGYDSCSTKMMPPGSVVIALAGQGKTRGMVARTRLECCTNQSLATIVPQSSMNSDYLFYYLKTQYAKLRDISSGDGTRGGLNLSMIRTYRIPVPPLAVQEEIVRVLDSFTSLEAELEAELEARKKQYEYYRGVLLNSSDDAGVRDVSLGEIIRLNFGARITKKDNAGTIYPVYGGGGESFRTDAFNREDEWVISRFAMSANCVRRVAGKFWMLDSGFTFDVTDTSVDKDFVGQLLLSMQPTIFATSTQSAQKNIDVDGFKRLRVQVPSLGTQRRVALALASFDGMVNDLSIGLPAEIAARRQQYEFYRDRLLSFKELAA